MPVEGVEHRVRHIAGRRGTVWLEEGEIRVAGDPAFLSRRVADFLRAEARRRLSALVAGKAAACWPQAQPHHGEGHAHPLGQLRHQPGAGILLAAGDGAARAGLRGGARGGASAPHMNHGPRFWALVETLSPHTEMAVRWLRDEGPRLMRGGAVVPTPVGMRAGLAGGGARSKEFPQPGLSIRWTACAAGAVPPGSVGLDGAAAMACSR